jgi:integrase
MRPGRERLRALQPGEKITAAGLEAERRPNGDLRFRAAVMVNRTRIHRVLGYESAGMTWAQAVAAVERLRTEERYGRLQLPKGRKLPLTLAMTAPLYLAELEATAGRSIAKKRQHLDMHVVRLLGNERLASLSEFTLRRYRKTRRDEGASDATINREMSTLSHVISIAMAKGWIQARPCRVPKVNEPWLPQITLSDAEQDALLAAAQDDSNTFLWLFVMVGLNSCMRHREILSLRFDRIDFAGCRVQIPDAKAGRRPQPITTELRDALRREQEMAEDPQGWVFPRLRQRDRGFSGQCPRMGEAFARAVKRAGITRRVTPHLMRHTGITRLIQAGSDLRTVQAISGHKTLAMLLRYLQTSGPKIDEAVALLGRAPKPAANVQDYTQITPRARRG